MCGLAGIFNFNSNKVDANEINRMTNSMFERGPDDNGVYVNGCSGIGFRRLSIIDLDGSHQPISNEDGTLHLVMNGEIYNYVALREQLISNGHVFKTNGDAEVLLHLYEERGVNALQELNGMFAFALLDNKKNQIFLGRDRFGVKPLFYAVNNNSFYFASTIKAIRTVFPTKIDADGLLKCIVLSYSPGDETVWTGIRRLLPAHHLVVGKNGVFRTTKYWDISSCQNWHGTTEKAVQILEAEFSNAIKLQIRSDVPVGVFLSGGLDSSALVAYASHLTEMPISTFTVNFKNKNSLDGLMSKAVAEKYATIHHEVEMNPKIASEQLTKLLNFMDEPITDSAIIPAYYLSTIAKAQGVKVLLSGAGADEIFAGYSRHWPPNIGTPAWVSGLKPGSIKNLLSALIYMVDKNRGNRSINPEVAWGVGVSGINLDIVRKLMLRHNSFNDVINIYLDQYKELNTSLDRKSYAHTRMMLDLKTYLPGDILSLMDKASMAASVECRVPFLDHKLVEFAYSLPIALNCINLTPKGLFKKMLANKLPSEIISRKKEGFNAPMNEWINSDKYFNVTDELLNQRATVMNEIFDSKALTDLLLKSKGTYSKHSSETIFSLYLVNRWVNAQEDFLI